MKGVYHIPLHGPPSEQLQTWVVSRDLIERGARDLWYKEEEERVEPCPYLPARVEPFICEGLVLAAYLDSFRRVDRSPVKGKHDVRHKKRLERRKHKPIEAPLWLDVEVERKLVLLPIHRRVDGTVHVVPERNHHHCKHVDIEQGPLSEGVKPHQNLLPLLDRDGRCRTCPAHYHDQQLQVRPHPGQQRNQKRQRVHPGIPHLGDRAAKVKGEERVKLDRRLVAELQHRIHLEI